MSRPVDERLRELEADVRDLPVLPAAAIRARGRSRGRRQRAALTVAAAVVATAAATLAWPHPRTGPVGDGAADRPAVSCVLTLPDDPAQVRIRVIDGGAPAGLLDTAAAELRARRFVVQTGTAGGKAIVDTAVLRYGPAAIGAAALLRAELHGQVAMDFDPHRRDETVDLTVGPAFTRLATVTEVNQNLVVAGEPSAPAQCRAG